MINIIQHVLSSKTLMKYHNGSFYLGIITKFKPNDPSPANTARLQTCRKTSSCDINTERREFWVTVNCKHYFINDMFTEATAVRVRERLKKVGQH